MKRWLSVLLMLFLTVPIAAAQSGKTDQAVTTSPEEVKKMIRQLDETFQNGVKNKNIDQVMKPYWNSSDLVVWSPEGNYKGYDALKKSWTTLFDQNDVKEFSLDNAEIDVHNNVAIENGEFTFEIVPKMQADAGVSQRGGREDDPADDAINDRTKTQGSSAGSHVMKGRFTTVWEIKDGKWVITTDHASVPIPSEGMNAAPGTGDRK